MSNAMKPPVAVEVGSAARAALGCVLATLIGSAALAQTTGTAAPKSDAAAASATQQPPPGGCMPIGVTVSGQIVFAFQCKDFLEQQKAANQDPAAAADKPATAEEKPAAGQEKAAPPAEEKHLAVEEKTAARQPNGAVPAKLTGQPTALLPKHAELLPKHAERGIGPAGCTHFRSYKAAAGTYLSFDGQRHPCREVAANQVSR
jgi:pyruvate/2-oxoglutarate dehydrogenase complex dihydrolipoamide acyltransferase (E2) component